MLLKEFISKAVEALESLYATSEARSLVFGLCEDMLGTKSYTHIVEPGFIVPEDKLPALSAGLARLVSGEPLQYVTGHAFFCGYDFRVTPDVLIPRQETELLCRHAVDFVSRITRMRTASGKYASPVRVLDLCTGSGCIAWTIALSVPGVEVVAVDNSDAALAVARSQSFPEMKKNKDIKAPSFLNRDILLSEPDADWGKFDLVTSNPPYVRDSEKAMMEKNVLEHEPASALFVPDDDPLLYYRAVAAWSRACLEHGGTGLAEINEALGKQTSDVFVTAGFQHAEVIRDFNDKCRVVKYSES